MGQYQRKHQRKNRRVRFGWLDGIISGLLILAAVGIANMWLAVFADVGVAVIAILNAMRAMNVKK